VGPYLDLRLPAADSHEILLLCTNWKRKTTHQSLSTAPALRVFQWAKIFQYLCQMTSATPSQDWLVRCEAFQISSTYTQIFVLL
jgi:hypothetical protein